MTFFNAINTFFKKSNIKLDYPINVVMGYKNSEYIDIALYGTNKKIDEILDHEIIDDVLSVVYENEKNEVCFESENDLNHIIKNLSLEKVLNRYKYIGTTEDNKFKIYLFLIPDSEEFQLPEFNNLKYKYLYKYENESQFTNAIYIEFIVRNATYNNLYSDISIIEVDPLPNESDEEFDFRTLQLLEEKNIEQDENLIKHYGFNYYEISSLNLTIFKDDIDFDDEYNEFFLSIIPTIEKPKDESILNLSSTEEDLIQNIKELKNIYDNNMKIHSNFQKINKEFKKNADYIINKFPKSFKKKKDQLIKALFIFDYIQAYNKSIDEFNISVKKEYETKKIEICNKYLEKQKGDKEEIEKFEAYTREADNFEERIKIEKQKKYQNAIDELEKDIKTLEKDEKKELLEIEKELKENLVDHTKMDPSKYDDSIFNEIASIIDEQPGQCKKFYNFIHKFLQKQITN